MHIFHVSALIDFTVIVVETTVATRKTVTIAHIIIIVIFGRLQLVIISARCARVSHRTIIASHIVLSIAAARLTEKSEKRNDYICICKVTDVYTIFWISFESNGTKDYLRSFSPSDPENAWFNFRDSANLRSDSDALAGRVHGLCWPCATSAVEYI